MKNVNLQLGAAVGITFVMAGSLASAAIGPHPATGAKPAVVRARPLTNVTPRATLVAGGATLPAIAYMGAFTGVNPKFLAAPTDAKSLFGYFDANNAETIQYCQTGSGYGKKVFNGDANVHNPVTGYGDEAVNLSCLASGTPVVGTNGFAAPQSGTGFPISDPDFAGSDAPLTQTEYTDFITNKHTNANATQLDRGEPVQVPYVVGSIALFYNNPDLGGKGQLKLSASQICNIVNGTYTNWSQLSQPARPLQFVYRADGSGTTFSFSNWLRKNSPGCMDSKGVALSVSQQFNAAVGVVVESNVPASSISASGNGAVAKCVALGTVAAGCSVASSSGNGTGLIGYVESANAQSLRNSAAGLDYATIGAQDPIKNLPEAANSIANMIKVDDAIQFNAGMLSTNVALAPVPTTPNCVTYVDPAAYNGITTGYPILAISNVEFSKKNNGTNNTKLQTLAKLQFSKPSGKALVYANQRTIGEHLASVNPIVIDSVDAATPDTGTGKTGYSTFPLSFDPATNATINTAINCIGV